MQESITGQSHAVTIDNRENLALSGISDVSGFDEQTVNLQTPYGNLIVKGENMHINKLSLESGDVSIDGKINSLQYLGDTRQKGFVSKLFK